jgi:NAD(P)-dependent dehydrogenase (short-subunit alcohol dehydrogenase family)
MSHLRKRGLTPTDVVAGLARPADGLATSRACKGVRMEDFTGRIAVVTGGGTGMGRELVVQLAAQGCSVALCDVNADTMDETRRRAEEQAPPGTLVTTHRCDVADPAQVDRFREEVRSAHDTDHVHLVFSNAGIGGGGSFVAGDREAWERTFSICWGGVYNVARSFLPLLVAADEGVLVNTSSVNGFWASLGPGVPHTAYSTAKFAVRGFSEALIEDLRVHAPHVRVAVVMPGHVGTDIVLNSRRVLGEDLSAMRADLARRGMPVESLSDDDLRGFVTAMAEGFRDGAPTSAAEAASIILDGVREGRWRILVGDDAVALDEAVRADPEAAYEPGGIGLGTINRA